MSVWGVHPSQVCREGKAPARRIGFSTLIGLTVGFPVDERTDHEALKWKYPDWYRRFYTHRADVCTLRPLRWLAWPWARTREN